jgi:hypothetical protein
MIVLHPPSNTTMSWKTFPAPNLNLEICRTNSHHELVTNRPDLNQKKYLEKSKLTSKQGLLQ